MIYYIVSVCIWVLLIFVANKTNDSMRFLVATMMIAGAVYGLAQLLQM